MEDGVENARVEIESLSYILSLLFHTVHYFTFFLHTCILYIILHSIFTPPYCTLSYILSLHFHNVHYLTLYQYGQVGIECMIMYSMDE
jgi:hypothetical protein